MSRIEKETALLPFLIAESVCMEAMRHCDDESIITYAEQLAQKAEAVYANAKDFAKKLKRESGRDYLYCFMRHWLAGALQKDSPHLFAKLPKQFANGVNA